MDQIDEKVERNSENGELPERLHRLMQRQVLSEQGKRRGIRECYNQNATGF
jgi:hypothetical protein